MARHPINSEFCFPDLGPEIADTLEDMLFDLNDEPQNTATAPQPPAIQQKVMEMLDLMAAQENTTRATILTQLIHMTRAEQSTPPKTSEMATVQKTDLVYCEVCDIYMKPTQLKRGQCPVCIKEQEKYRREKAALSALSNPDLVIKKGMYHPTVEDIVLLGQLQGSADTEKGLRRLMGWGKFSHLTWGHLLREEPNYVLWVWNNSCRFKDNENVQEFVRFLKEHIHQFRSTKAEAHPEMEQEQVFSDSTYILIQTLFNLLKPRPAPPRAASSNHQ